MKVVATAKGFLGKLRDIGEEFDAPEGLKASWFVPVVPPEAPKPAGKDKAGKTEKDAGESLV